MKLSVFFRAWEPERTGIDKIQPGAEKQTEIGIG